MREEEASSGEGLITCVLPLCPARGGRGCTGEAKWTQIEIEAKEANASETIDEES